MWRHESGHRSLVRNLSSCEIEACFIFAGVKDPMQSTEAVHEGKNLSKPCGSTDWFCDNYELLSQTENVGYRVQSSKCGLWKSPKMESDQCKTKTADCGLQTAGCGLGVKCRLCYHFHNWEITVNRLTGASFWLTWVIFRLWSERRRSLRLAWITQFTVSNR